MPESFSENDLKSKLGLDIPSEKRKQIISDLIDLHKTDTLFSVGGKCNNTPLNIYPDHYFLAQSFDGKKDDMRNALQATFNKFNLSVKTVDTELGGFLFCNIAALILGTPFGVYHVDNAQKPNVYIELGVSIGLRKPFILVKDQGTNIAPILDSIHYYELNDYFSLTESFGDLTNSYMTRIGYIDNSLISYSRSKTTEVCLSLGDLETVDIGLTLAMELVKHDYQPVFLSDTNKTLARFLEQREITPVFYKNLPDVTDAISRSKFGVYRIDKSASSSSFVNLGIAIGLNSPTFLINNKRELPPSDLSIFESLKFEGRTDLEELFTLEFPKWKERFSA